jgi:hypothetical protein
MTSVFCFQMIVTSAPLHRRNQNPASLNACPVDQLRLQAPQNSKVASERIADEKGWARDFSP